MDEPERPRSGRGHALSEAICEDLELFAVSDLSERIEILKAEIMRAEAEILRKQAGRSAAEALFGGAGS